jgi:hypothetical protein
VLALLLLLALNLLLFFPHWLWDVHPLVPLHLSFELVALVAAAVLSAGTTLARPLRRAGAVSYAALLLLLGYQHAFGYFYMRPPALGEDWRLLLNLIHFLGTLSAIKWSFVTLAAIAGLGATGWATAFALGRTQKWAVERTPALRFTLALGLLALTGGALAVTGVASDTSWVQLPSKRLADNWRASRVEAERRAALEAAPPDRSYDAFDAVKLTRKPSVYLLMMESYGEVLATWDMAPAYRALMARAEQRLSAKGFRAVTQYSAAPVHGGMSWFSIATVNTGVPIDRPLAHQALERAADHLPTLPEFFRGQGYRTYSVQPGSKQRAGLGKPDLFGHDVVVDAQTLDYRGAHRWGYGEMPDQWALQQFRTHQLVDAPEPRYLFYMSVSSHLPWGEEVPPWLRDWRDPDGATAETDETWGPIAGVEQIGTALRQSYFRSVAYDWRAFLELLDQDTAQDLVVVIMGDHQPRLELDTPVFSMNTPVHVIARDPALLAGFEQAGFQPGLFAEPGRRPPLQHQGLFSLIVSRLAARYSDRPVLWFPDGVGLAALKR